MHSAAARHGLASGSSKGILRCCAQPPRRCHDTVKCCVLASEECSSTCMLLVEILSGSSAEPMRAQCIESRPFGTSAADHALKYHRVGTHCIVIPTALSFFAIALAKQCHAQSIWARRFRMRVRPPMYWHSMRCEGSAKATCAQCFHMRPDVCPAKADARSR